MLTTLVASAVVLQTQKTAPVYDPNSQGQNVFVTAELGKAKFAGDDSIELVGISDLTRPRLGAWSASGTTLESGASNLYWKVLDLSNEEIEQYKSDRAGRTICVVLRLNGAQKAQTLPFDEIRSIRTYTSKLRKVDGISYLALVIGPKYVKDEVAKTLDLRIEVPGGAWNSLLQFPLAGETKENGIEVIKRYQLDARFATINGKEEIVRWRIHYFTATLPTELRGTDLIVVSNDPEEDFRLLDGSEPVHILGEDQGQEFVGKDLFIVPCVNKLNFDRVFTLRWRPKRIAVFNDLPLKR